MTEKDLWITEVEIKNFQSHKHTVISFVKGTNALVGTSNSGKSATIRAIKWCLINTPNGTDFITVGESEASVKVTLSNGKAIERIRNRKSVNLYRLYENGECISEYTGFGKNPPPEIIEAHGIQPIANDLYFQFAHQLESAFLLSLRPSQRADVLGNLDELLKIDGALSSINDDIRSLQKDKKIAEKSEKELTLEYDRLKRETDRLAGKIDTLKALKESIETNAKLQTYLKGQLVRLKEIGELTQGLNEQLDRANRIIENYPENIEERIQKFRVLQNFLNRLRTIKEELSSISYMNDEKLTQLEKMKVVVEEKITQYQSLSHATERLKYIKQEITKTQNSYSDKVAAVEFKQLDLDIAKYSMMLNHFNRLRKIDDDIFSSEKMIESASEQIDHLLDQFLSALQEAEICPTCGQETCDVHTKTLENVIQ